MKKISKCDEPSEMKQYRDSNPQNSWDQFKGGKGRKASVQRQLMMDQGGLCAYCEINLLLADNPASSDFRVEHFHPKSDDSTTHNWHLDWKNLLACCHGGSSRNVVDANIRFTEDHAERSCDIPKDNYVWDDMILNPLELPATTCLFQFSRNDGSMRAHENQCLDAGVELQRAEASIEKLRLNSQRLKLLRQPILNKLNDSLRNMCGSGMELKQARRKLAKSMLIKNSDGNWPAFFSAIRSYLGQEAERHLAEITYDG